MEKTQLVVEGRSIPVLISHPRGVKEAAPRVMLVCHGLGAAKEAQIPEMEKLAASGLTAVCLDAPHHGERRTGYLEKMEQAAPAERHHLMLGLVDEAAREIPLVIGYLKKAWGAHVGIVGISMGGFTAFAAALYDPKPQLCVPIIASPDWYSFSPHVPEIQLEKRMKSPCGFPERFKDVALLSIVAGRDTTVFPGPAKAFVQKLKEYYFSNSGNFEIIEYAESEHFMRESDWNAAWHEIIRWCKKHL